MKGEVEMGKLNTNERGNVLFLILIAVALFAALSYAVTQSSRSGGDSGRETSILNSAQLSQYPNSVRTAVLRQVIDGIPVTSVDFNTPTDFGNISNTGFGNRTGVFHPEGGGAVFQDAPGDMMADGIDGTWYYNMEHEVEEIGLSVGGSGGNDLIAFLPGVSEAVCQRINVEAGVKPNISDAPPVTADLSASYVIQQVNADGSTPYAITGNVQLESGTDLVGKPFGCFENVADSNVFVYYHVINER